MVKKKVLLMLIMAMLPFFSLCTSAANPDDIDLEVEFDDPDYGQNPPSRTPILVPHVGIDGYTLTFYTSCDGCTLRLLNENDNVVYSTVISSGTSTLVLPSYLSGDYRIEIIRGTFCFWGYVEL